MTKVRILEFFVEGTSAEVAEALAQLGQLLLPPQRDTWLPDVQAPQETPAASDPDPETPPEQEPAPRRKAAGKRTPRVSTRCTPGAIRTILEDGTPRTVYALSRALGYGSTNSTVIETVHKMEDHGDLTSAAGKYSLPATDG